MPRHVEVPATAREDFAAWRAATRENFYTRDPALDLALRRHSPELHAAHVEGLRELGQTVATQVEEDAFTACDDPNIPRLARWDGLGNRTEEIELHPAYIRMGRVAWGARTIADYEEPGRELVQMARFFLLAFQGEAPHLCPLTCTAGLVKALQLKGDEELQARYLPGLLNPDFDECLYGSQFVTEVQGGSDVGAGAVTAVPSKDTPGAYEIHGEKWFCSVINSDLFLLTARVEGQGEGTRGLGCFVVPRRLPDGSVNAFHIRRLKKKLGTRAMASGEVDWNGSLGWPIGPLDEGFKTVVSVVLQTSRIYNAVGTAGSTMRAYLDARDYARHRRAFGAPIVQFPEVRRTLARMKANAWGCLHSTFHVTALSERCATGQGSEADRSALRMLTNVNKYWTSIVNTRTVRDGMEVLGGNGTIEDFSVLPRLFKDAMVLESWEGAHNVLAAQVARDTLRGDLDVAMLDALDALHGGAPESAAGARLAERLGDLRRRYQALRELDPEAVQAAARPLLDRTAVAYQIAALLDVATAGGAGAAEAVACGEHLEALYPDAAFDAPSMEAVAACLDAG